jgi:hypothetical protein
VNNAVVPSHHTIESLVELSTPPNPPHFAAMADLTAVSRSATTLLEGLLPLTQSGLYLISLRR